MDGDYYSLDRAKKIVKSRGFKQTKEDKLLWALDKTNEKRGISNVKATLQGDDLEIYNRALQALVYEGINPVTIPRNYSIKHIPNLLNAYYDKLSDEQIKKQDDDRSLDRVKEYLA